MKIEKLDLDKIIPYARNARQHSDAQVAQIAASIHEFGFNSPILIDENNVIIAGHGRYAAAQKLQLDEVPVIRLEHLSDIQKKAYILADNKLALNASWDDAMLALELAEIKAGDLDIALAGFTDEDLSAAQAGGGEAPGEEVAEGKTEPDAVPEKVEPMVKPGEIWQLGNHRLMCGDSTDGGAVALLMDGQKADLVFTDPPYGMKKEAEGVINDNLNYDDLLEFNRKWIALVFMFLKENGSFYCWGTDEPLMDIYSGILKPMIKEGRITFRNLITWNKGTGQGQLEAGIRMYPIFDEKCLFVMNGVQGFNTNADNYFEGWEPIRGYLLTSRQAMGWDVPTMKRIVGHSDLSRDHWTGKSQFNLPTREVYNRLKEAAEKQRQEKGISNDAFKKEYDEIKKDYYATRAYFDNMHDKLSNVWDFAPVLGKAREECGGHPTPKPVALCIRGIKTSSRAGESVLDLFGGSGTTLIACEQTGRKARLMELDPHYCDMIIKRWEDFTGQKAVKEE